MMARIICVRKTITVRLSEAPDESVKRYAEFMAANLDAVSFAQTWANRNLGELAQR